MSVTTTTKTSVTGGPRGYPEYDRHYSQRISTESRRRIGIQDLINEPIRTEQFHHDYQQSPELRINQFNRYSLSPPYLPLPLPQQHKQHYLMPNTPSMALYSYRLPTSLMSPISTPVTSPSLAPIQSYSSSSSTASKSPIMSKSNDQNSYTAIFSLQELREKNKIASAKYRAKKNRQNQEMSTTIAELTADKDVLLKKLEDVKAENLELKELVDKLKSKLVEGRILKRLGQGGAKLSLSPTLTVDDPEITSNSNVSTTIRKNKTKRGGFSDYAKGTGPSVKGARK